MITTVLLSLLLAAPTSAPTTVYLVRHAEKVTEPKTDDPELTAGGQKRADALARLLAKSNIRAIYATEYKRTQKTVAPLAKAVGLTVAVKSSKDSEAFAKDLLEKHRGETIVVAGHSNTVPEIIKALGIAQPVTIPDSDYGGLYVVVRDGPAREPILLVLHYGE